MSDTSTNQTLIVDFGIPVPPKDEAEPAWQHHAKKLTSWRHCMSYNDSYFGEPPGLLKQVVAELERLMPPHPVKVNASQEGGAA